MSVLKFNGYQVDQMSYQRNEQYDGMTKKVVLAPKITTNTDVHDNDISVTLTITVGSVEGRKMPFQATCSLTGIFDYQSDEDDAGVGLDQLVRNNAVAILYPYVRAIITNLTASSNEYPGYVLPTINVGKVLAEQD